LLKTILFPLAKADLLTDEHEEEEETEEHVNEDEGEEKIVDMNQDKGKKRKKPKGHRRR